jgi:hypothetical protein
VPAPALAKLVEPPPPAPVKAVAREARPAPRKAPPRVWPVWSQQENKVVYVDDQGDPAEAPAESAN